MNPFVLLAVGAVTPHPQVAVGEPWQLSVEGQLRPRFVTHTGRDFAEETLVDQLYVSQRSRLGVVLQHADGTQVTVRLQDVRFWGEETDTLDASAEGVDFHEAALRLPLMEGTTLTVGRQEFAWDQQRLIGQTNWAQRGRAYDGLRLRWVGEAADAEAIVLPILASSNTHPPLGDADGHVDPARTDDTWLAGLHAHTAVGAGIELTGLYLFRRDGALEEKRHTVGGLASVKRGGLNGSLEGYYQLGDLGQESIGAWMTGARLGYTFDAIVKPQVTLIGDVLSGDGQPTGAFDTLYGTNHGLYGELDFFTNIPRHTAGLGLLDAAVRVGMEPTQGLAIKGDFHQFRSVEPGPNDETDFGQEIDVNLDWKASEQLSLAVLVGIFLPGDLWKVTRGPADASAEQALYVTTDYRF